jgi:GMP synthase (glutamine-hydrolysing)
MILIIDVCRDRLHCHEFVRPVEDVLSKGGIEFRTKRYREISPRDLEEAGSVIITGTSLKDNGYMDDIGKFGWIKSLEKPLLGICAGMQLIGMAFGGKVRDRTEIGFSSEPFRGFLGLEGEEQVYHLHNHYVDFRELDDFEVLAGEDVPQAVKHRKLPVYGVLFHPEVRQKGLLLRFASV